MNRMAFSTNSNETDRMVSIVAYIHSLVNEYHFTRNELEELHANCQNPIEKMDKGSISKNISYLKKYNYCAKDGDGKYFITDDGIKLSNTNDEIEKRNIIINAINNNYTCIVRDMEIKPFAYVLNYLKELGGKVSKPELIPLLFVSNKEEYEELLLATKCSRATRQIEPIINFVEKMLRENKIEDKDIKKVVEREVTRPTFALKSLGLLDETPYSVKHEVVEFPGGHKTNPDKHYMLTEIGYKYIYDEDYIEYMENNAEDLQPSDEPEENWSINTRTPQLETINHLKKYKKDPKIAKYIKKKSNGVCFFNEIEMGHKHFIPPAEKNGDYIMDSHHSVPMEFQSEFDVNLDHTLLVIPLCLTCHAILHRGRSKEKEILVNYIYYIKKDILKNLLNINTLEEFKRFYRL